MIDILFAGIGWTDIALTLSRIAVGAFFMLSGYHKLFNAERHRMLAEELRGLGIHSVGFNQWWVPTVEFAAGFAVVIGSSRTAGRAWSAFHQLRRHRHDGTAADQNSASRSIKRIG